MTEATTKGRATRWRRPRVRRDAAMVSMLVLTGSVLFEAAPNVASAAVVAPGAPTASSAVPGNGRATVQWTAPANNGGAAVTGYVVTPILAGVAQPVRTFNSAATTQNVTGLTNKSSYTFTVAAKSSAGTGPPSGATAPILVGLPTAPTAVVASATPGRATVSWNAPSANGGFALTGYVVTPYKAGVKQGARSFSSTQLSQPITGLTNNAQYTFRVAAKNTNGVGLPSAATAPITVGSPKAPSAPTAVTTVPGNGQIVLTWAAPASNGSASVVRYVVTPYVGNVAQPTRTFDSRTSQVLSGLNNGTTYRFVVVAGNAAGNSPPSATSAAVVAGTPNEPRSVAAVPASGRATVTWVTPVPNNTGAISGYVITPYVGTVAQSPIIVGAVTGKVITGLSHATTYTFKVAATNAIGTGRQSTGSNAMRPNGAPIARADAYATDEDTGLEVAAPGVLANDTDADDDPLELQVVGVGLGSVDLRPDGSFSYEPYIDSDADDHFTYRVGDGITWSAPVRVDIDVRAVNDPPIVEGEQYETFYETVLDVPSPGVLANDYDPVEFDGVSASLYSGPQHGTLVLSSNGAFTYTPDPGFSGVDGFSYMVSDSGPGGVASAEIVVDPPDPPVDP